VWAYKATTQDVQMWSCRVDEDAAHAAENPKCRFDQVWHFLKPTTTKQHFIIGLSVVTEHNTLSSI